jgi:hypothetical protein
MPSSYLQISEYPAWGLPSSTTAGQVQQASTMIDVFLRRPEGLVWTPDADGMPAFMAAAEPSATCTLQDDIAAGQNVAATLSGPVGMIQPGDVLIVDRDLEGGKPEALVLGSVLNQAVTFRSVAYPHASGAVLEAGMTITEQKFLPKNRPITMLSRYPVANIVSGSGRYGYSRRGESATSNMEDFNLLAALSHFGGPPAWEVFDPRTTDVDPLTGQCWIPAGIMLAYYTEVKVRYVAGYQASAIPFPIKQACAMLVQAMEDAPALGAVKRYQAGGTAIERFADTMISGDVKRALLPYQAKAMA